MLGEAGIGEDEGDTRGAFKHILNSARLWNSEGPALLVPFPWNVKDRHFRNANMDALTEAGLLFLHVGEFGNDYSVKQGRCRQYGPEPGVLRRYEDAVEDGIGAAWVNLFSGKRIRRKPKHETDRTDPDAMREAWALVRPCSFDMEAGKKVLAHGRALRLTALARLRSGLSDEDVRLIADLEEGRVEPRYVRQKLGSEKREWIREYRRAAGRYANDRRCFERVVYGLRSAPTEEGGPLRALETYRQSSTGRSSAIAGAYTNMSGELKQAMLYGTDGQRNYDMESSQDRILLELFERAGICCPWLSSFLDAEDAKQDLADRTGLSRGAVKTCLHAMKMGSPVQATPHSDVFEAIRRDVGPVEAEEVFAAFAAEVEPLTEALKEWHQYLTGAWLSEHAANGHGSKRYVRNDVAMSFCVSDVATDEEIQQEPGKRKALARKLAAFLLQGREAQILYEFVRASEKYGYEVRSLQHDGFVCVPGVPEEAAAEVRRVTGADYVRLEEKPFA